MKHYIFTRWNLLTDSSDLYNNSLIKDKDSWMRHRVELFEKYTLPSVMKQTNKNFIWLLSFSKNTPKHYYQKYLQNKFIKIIHTSHIKYLKDNLISDNIFITSRLDNDDVIFPEYINTIQKSIGNYTTILDSYGYSYNILTKKWYIPPERKRTNSPFLTLVEFLNPGEFPKTCFYDQHSVMPDYFPGRWINKQTNPLYCIIVHDKNLMNKSLGKEIIVKNSF